MRDTVEINKYTLLMKIVIKEDFDEAMDIIKDEFNKNLDNVYICMQVKNLICDIKKVENE
jgi:hypothetical protein